jgi:hypothetical protein
MPAPQLPRPQTDEAVYLAAILAGLAEVTRAVQRLTEVVQLQGRDEIVNPPVAAPVKKSRARKPSQGVT